MKENPLVSIIVPIYNASAYLRDCLDSILRQSYNNIEVILIDDGSTDESGIICDKYASSFSQIKIFHQKNCGSSAARNKGLEVAVGDYLYFVDADDWIDGGSVELLVSEIQKNDSDLLISAFYYNEDKYQPNKASSFNPIVIISELFEGQKGIEGGLWNKFIKRTLMDSFGIKFPKYDYYEDLHVFVELLFNARKISYCETPSYHYRRTPDSQTLISDPNKRIKHFYEFSYNMTDVFNKYSLWEHNTLLHNFFLHVNGNKRRLLILPLTYNEEIKEAMKQFPLSYRFLNKQDKGYILYYLAYKYRIIWPIHLCLITKKKIKERINILFKKDVKK